MRRLSVLLIAALAAPAAAAPTDRATALSPSEARLQDALGDAGDAAAAASDMPVRRWEYVLLVRTAPEVPNAIGHAELATLKAGGAVLEELHDGFTASHSDYRLLVRTRDQDAIHDVLRALRKTAGVLGATFSALPETPTYPGGPSFFESYSGPQDDRPSNADRVVMRHDVPPILDKRELLEMSDVLAAPSTGPDGQGGFTLNVSELFARMKEGSWRRREERLRATPIEILPPEPSQDGAANAP